MKGLKKLVLVSAIAAAPFAQAELKAIDDAAMSEMTGQSGLLIEVGMGTVDATDITTVDWSNAGITIEAFKWEVDLGQYDAASNVHAEDGGAAMGGALIGGVIAQGISIAGGVDVTVDGVVGSRNGSAHGGIAIGFEDSNINMRVDSISAYATTATVNALGAPAGTESIGHSMGAIEIIGMNVDKLDLTISGR